MPKSKEPIPVYFSHSYRLEDRELNQFFWELFFQTGFHFTVDPKSGVFSISYLELMMEQSACFAAVVTERPQQANYRCSPYILFEYGLSVQARKPALVFVERGVSASYFNNADTCFFNRQKGRLEADKGNFIKKIAALQQKSAAYRNSDIRPRGEVGLILSGSQTSKNIYSTVLPALTLLLKEAGYGTENVDLDFENSLTFSLKLDRFDFVILSVDPEVNPPWIYPFIHGRFIPSIKLFHLSASAAVENLPLLLSRHLIQGVNTVEDSILFWRTENELLDKFKTQLNKFDLARTELDTLEKGNRYFKSIGRKPLYVFISNANDSNDFSAVLSEGLNVENINHFQYKFQNNIPQGEEWKEKLESEVKKSKLFIALITNEYLNSKWCQLEFNLALGLKERGEISILPYFLEKVDNFALQAQSLVGISDDGKKDIIIKDLDTLLTQEQLISAKSARDKDSKNINEDKNEKVDSIDIALITILPEEYEAVLKYLDNHRSAPSTNEQKNLNAWTIGEIKSSNHARPYKVVVAMAGKAGNTAGYQVTKATIDRWRPRYALLIGIAGGLSSRQIKKGDVVISTIIWGYEYGKVDNGFIPRHNYTFPTDNPLVTSAQAFAITNPQWVEHIKATAPDSCSPSLKAGIVGSGDKVIDNLDDPYVLSILQAEPKIIAVEMEGAGSAAAIKSIVEEGRAIGFTMIRGISDLPKGANPTTESTHPTQTDERDAWKQYASESAACFATHLIRYRWTEPPLAENS